MMHVKFNSKAITDGLDRYVWQFAAVDIDGIVCDVLDDVGNEMLLDMQERVAAHSTPKKRAYNALKFEGVKTAGNYHSIEVGAMDIRGEDKDGFHIIYQEYGSPGHTTAKGKQAGVFRADPWLRPAVETAKKRLRVVTHAALKRWGASNAA